MKFSLFLLTIILSFSSYSKIDPIIPFDKVIIKDGLPQEFGILISSYQNYQLSLEEKEELREIIYGLDHSFKIISAKNIIYYNLNLELHKLLIDYFPTKSLKKLPEQRKFLLSLRNIQLSTNTDFPFVRWIMDKILIELNTLVSSPHYKALLLLQKTQKRLNKSELVSIKKRIEMLLPWYTLFKISTADQLIHSTKPIMYSSLLRLYKYSQFQAKLASSDAGIPSAKSPSELSFFEPITKTVNEVTAIEPTNLTFDNLPKPVNDWIPSEDDFQNDLFPERSLEYIIPKELPDAVNDWESFLNSKEEYDFFPEPNSNYIKPMQLPLVFWPMQ